MLAPDQVRPHWCGVPCADLFCDADLAGLWAIEVAKEFPSAHVIGMDISVIQPTNGPMNCEFRFGDLTKDLYKFESDSFDYVHSRYTHDANPPNLDVCV